MRVRSPVVFQTAYKKKIWSPFTVTISEKYFTVFGHFYFWVKSRESIYNLIFRNIPCYTVQELGEYIARIWEDLQLAYFCCWSSKRFFTKIKKTSSSNWAQSVRQIIFLMWFLAYFKYCRGNYNWELWESKLWSFKILFWYTNYSKEETCLF